MSEKPKIKRLYFVLTENDVLYKRILKQANKQGIPYYKIIRNAVEAAL